MPSTFETTFATLAVPGLLTQFGTAVERWVEGDSSNKQPETWLVDYTHEQGDNSGLADKIPLDRKGSKADLYLTLIGERNLSVKATDKFEFTHPTSGSVVLANVVRRIYAGAMQAWLVVIPFGIDTKGARVRN